MRPTDNNQMRAPKSSTMKEVGKKTYKKKLAQKTRAGEIEVAAVR